MENSKLKKLSFDIEKIIVELCGGFTLFQSLARSCTYFYKNYSHLKLKDRLAYHIANREVLNLDRIWKNADFEEEMRQEFGVDKNESTLLEIYSHKRIGFPRLIEFKDWTCSCCVLAIKYTPSLVVSCVP